MFLDANRLDVTLRSPNVAAAKEAKTASPTLQTSRFYPLAGP